MIQKTYLSRAMTRAMALDHPIGDPTGGAAYGEKNDPISAAISLGSMYMTAGAAFGGSIMAGVAFGGAALSLVGNITGNAKLSKIGMVAGLVGGAGMMGMFGDTAQAASWGSTFGGEAAGGANATGALSQTPTAAPTVEPGNMVGGAEAVAPSAPPVADTALSQSQAFSQAPYDAGTATRAVDFAGPSAAQPAPALGGVNGVAGVETPSVAGVETPSVNATAPASNAAYDPATATRASDFGRTAEATNFVPGKGFVAPEQSYMQQFGAFAQKNPMAAYGLINSGAQAVGGVADWLSGKSDAEIEALKANTGFADAKALEIQTAIEKEKRRRENLNAGYTQVNTGVTVNPNAAMPQPWARPNNAAPQPFATQQALPGLIAGARG